ncbi:MAG: hypothetical protein JKY34_11015 [Kordiimonadaceae bacterium]|nr:hypothetical protein [Kordiimonadaceae bacterium]
MKQFIKAACLAITLLAVALLAAVPTQATETDEAAVLAVISGFFKAMEAKDTTRIREIMLPESHTLRVIDGSDKPYAISDLDKYVNGLATAKVKFQERIIYPEIKINGRLGYVWTFFQIFIDDSFAGCGINLFNMVKNKEAWRMASGTYSVIPRDKCASYYAPTDWQDGIYIIEK